MAKYGARNSKWALHDTTTPDTDATKLPKYQTAKQFGQLNKVTDSPNFAEGSLPGDDVIVLQEKTFKDGTVDVEHVFISLLDAAAILGASATTPNQETPDLGGMAEGLDDKAPLIGYGFVTQHVKKGASYWQVIFYPSLKATAVGETHSTRGDSITFETDKLSFVWLSPACRKYRIKQDFTTEAAANAYLDGLLAGTSAVPGLTAASQGN